MTHPIFLEIKSLLPTLPDFFELTDIAFFVTTSGGLLHLPRKPMGAPRCACPDVKGPVVSTSAKYLFDHVEILADCLVDLQPPLKFPAVVRTLSDYPTLLKLASTLNDLPSWESVSFDELLEFARTLTALGLFHPFLPPDFPTQLNPQGLIKFLSFQPTNNLNTLELFMLPHEITKRLTGEFYHQTLDFCSNIKATNTQTNVEASTEDNQRRVSNALTGDALRCSFFTLNNQEALSRSVRELTELSLLGVIDFSELVERMLEVLLLPSLLNQSSAGGQTSKSFSPHPKLGLTLSRVQFDLVDIYRTPEPLNYLELELFIKLTNMHLSVDPTRVYTGADMLSGVYAQESLMPAWDSFKAIFK